MDNTSTLEQERHDLVQRLQACVRLQGLLYSFWTYPPRIEAILPHWYRRDILTGWRFGSRSRLTRKLFSRIAQPSYTLVFRTHPQEFTDKIFTFFAAHSVP